MIPRISWTIQTATRLVGERQNSTVIIAAFATVCPSLSIDLQNSELAMENRRL